MPLVENTQSFGIDNDGNIESIFMFADSLAEFWREHAAEIEGGTHRVAVTMRLVPTDEPGWENWYGFEEEV